MVARCGLRIIIVMLLEKEEEEELPSVLVCH
jgi:hypothetical protein